MSLHLTIATPTELLVDRIPIEIVRAEDELGGFGVMAGHTDLLTVAARAILRWRQPDAGWRFCAAQGVLMVMSDGTDFRVSAREALIGERLETLEEQIRTMRGGASEQARRDRVAATRLQAEAVRSLVAHLRASPPQGEGYG